MMNIGILAHKPIGERCINYFFDKKNLNLNLRFVVTNFEKIGWWKSNLIYSECLKRNIPCINNDSHRDTEILEQIKENDVKALVSVQHLLKLSPEVLKAVNYCSYNLHNARLPNYKGYNCVSHAILNGDRKYYSTLHRMADEVDAGPLIKELSTPITKNDTAESLYAKSQELSFVLFKFIISQLSDGNKIETVPYDSNSKGKWYSKHDINKFRCINNLHDFQEVDRKSRAFYFQGHEPSFFLLGDKKFYVSPDFSKE